MQVVIGKVRGLISEYGLTAADLGLTGKVSKFATTTRKKKSVAAKPVGIPVYADPASGKTWTGNWDNSHETERASSVEPVGEFGLRKLAKHVI